MVDLAIAANFARELTEDQFAEQRPRRRRRTPDRRAVKGGGPSPSGRSRGVNPGGAGSAGARHALGLGPLANVDRAHAHASRPGPGMTRP
jgi:hypothetical protein